MKLNLIPILLSFACIYLFGCMVELELNAVFWSMPVKVVMGSIAAGCAAFWVLVLFKFRNWLD